MIHQSSRINEDNESHQYQFILASIDHVNGTNTTNAIMVTNNTINAINTTNAIKEITTTDAALNHANDANIIAARSRSMDDDDHAKDDFVFTFVNNTADTMTFNTTDITTVIFFRTIDDDAINEAVNINRINSTNAGNDDTDTLYDDATAQLLLQNEVQILSFYKSHISFYITNTFNHSFIPLFYDDQFNDDIIKLLNDEMQQTNQTNVIITSADIVAPNIKYFVDIHAHVQSSDEDQLKHQANNTIPNNAVNATNDAVNINEPNEIDDTLFGISYLSAMLYVISFMLSSFRISISNATHVIISNPINIHTFNNELPRINTNVYKPHHYIPHRIITTATSRIQLLQLNNETVYFSVVGWIFNWIHFSCHKYNSTHLNTIYYLNKMILFIMLLCQQINLMMILFQLLNNEISVQGSQYFIQRMIEPLNNTIVIGTSTNEMQHQSLPRGINTTVIHSIFDENEVTPHELVNEITKNTNNAYDPVAPILTDVNSADITAENENTVTNAYSSIPNAQYHLKSHELSACTHRISEESCGPLFQSLIFRTMYLFYFNIFYFRLIHQMTTCVIQHKTFNSSMRWCSEFIAYFMASYALSIRSILQCLLITSSILFAFGSTAHAYDTTIHEHAPIPPIHGFATIFNVAVIFTLIDIEPVLHDIVRGFVSAARRIIYIIHTTITWCLISTNNIFCTIRCYLNSIYTIVYCHITRYHKLIICTIYITICYINIKYTCNTWICYYFINTLAPCILSPASSYSFVPLILSIIATTHGFGAALRYMRGFVFATMLNIYNYVKVSYLLSSGAYFTLNGSSAALISSAPSAPPFISLPAALILAEHGSGATLRDSTLLRIFISSYHVIIGCFINANNIFYFIRCYLNCIRCYLTSNSLVEHLGLWYCFCWIRYLFGCGSAGYWMGFTFNSGYALLIMYRGEHMFITYVPSHLSR